VAADPSTSVELARQHWEEGFRRLESQRHERKRYAALHDLVEVVIAELRRRVGATYTLAELADHYRRADSWIAEVFEERVGGAGWVGSASTAADAAFHLYSRGARDYRP
jgi:hypothetical protein